MTRATLFLAACLLLGAAVPAGAQLVCTTDDECNNGDFCDGVETCVLMVCVPGTPPCDEGGQCGETCNEETNTCESADGDACNDGLFCNGMDACLGGICTPSGQSPCAGGDECQTECQEATDQCADDPGTPCTDDGNVCTTNVCNGMGECTSQPADGISCNDGLFCTVTDQCSNGMCVGTGNPCAGRAQCQTACQEATRECADPMGTPCADDDNECTANECNGMGQCAARPLTDTPCSDGNACTETDRCVSGACVGSGDPCDDGPECQRTCNPSTGQCADPAGTVCTADDNECTGERCNGMGACTSIPLTGLPCNDGLFCTEDDSCNAAGTCVGSGDPCTGGPACQNVCNEAANNCIAPGGTPCPDDGNQCTFDRCNTQGQCRHPDRPEGTACDDGQFCTATDACTEGACVGAGDPCAGGPECAATCNEAGDDCFAPSTTPCTDDGNLCTDDRCNGTGACGHPPNTLPCDDGVFCNGADVCADGACTHAGDPCAGGPECADVCDEAARNCITPAGTPCGDDGVECTSDVCLAGVCDHSPVHARCDQGECVLGACMPSGGGADKRGCVATPVAEGEQCTDDGFSCTDDTCNGGNCLHVPIASRCVPPDDCTSAVCAPGQASADDAGCIPGPALEEGQECAEDGEPCTNDRCRTGMCAHDAVPDTATCEPVTRAFRQALALEGLARRLMASVGDAFAPATSGQGLVLRGDMEARLAPVTASLEQVSRTLSGKSALPPTDGRVRGVPKTLAQLRAEAALAELDGEPAAVRAFLRLVGSAKRRKELPRESVRALRASGRLVLQRMRKLKKELRRLRRVSQTFVP